jgi:hypothetical protein
MTHRFSSLVASIAAAVVLAIGAAAHANPKALPFSYGTGTQAPGGLEIEQYVDIIGVRLARELADGSAESTTVPRYVLQTELEYGITDRVEVGMYFVFRQGASVDTPGLRFQGIKQRVRWRFSPASWPFSAGAYLEIAEFHDELEFEQKLLLEKRFGRLRAVVNLWIEQEWYFVTDETKFIYNPTVGATYELHPAVQVGAEYWVRGRFDDATATESSDYGDSSAPDGAHHYAGPTLLLQGGEHWLAVGAYVRLDGLGHSTAVDDPYGRFWIRVIAGIGM